MEHCSVEMQVVDSRTEETGEAVFDVLTFRCPICGKTEEVKFPRSPETRD